jgi:hypothetical protein
MEKEFIPYEQALALKELGFDEPCFSYYLDGKLNIFHNTSVNDRINSKTKDIFNSDVIVAPLYQQAFKWFREKYKISGEISSDYYLEGKDNEWEYNIYQLGKEDDGYVGTIPIFKTPEEAELECLKKLIEIVKEK